MHLEKPGQKRKDSMIVGALSHLPNFIVSIDNHSTQSGRSIINRSNRSILGLHLALLVVLQLLSSCSAQERMPAQSNISSGVAEQVETESNTCRLELKALDDQQIWHTCDVSSHIEEKILKISNCKLSEQYYKLALCNSLSIPEVCRIQLEINQVAAYRNLKFIKSKSCNLLVHELILKSIIINQMTESINLIANPEEIDHLHVRFQNLRFQDYVQPGSFAAHHFVKAESMHWSQIEAPEVPLALGFNKMNRLNEFIVSDSQFNELSENAIYLNSVLRSVKLDRVHLIRGGLKPNSFIISNDLCDVNSQYSVKKSIELNIELADMKLETEELASIFVIAPNSNGQNQCLTGLKLNLSITGQNLDRSLPKEALSTFLDKFLSKGIELNFKSEADCCLKQNHWLLSSAARYENGSKSNLMIGCLDLGVQLDSVKNLTDLKNLCYKRNVLPVLVIAIVASILLTILMGVFSYICVVHVMPRKKQEILIKSEYTGNLVESDGHGKMSALMQTPDLSRVIELRSSETAQTLVNSQPLFSNFSAKKISKTNSTAKAAQPIGKLESIVPPKLKDLERSSEHANATGKPLEIHDYAGKSPIQQKRSLSDAKLLPNSEESKKASAANLKVAPKRGGLLNLVQNVIKLPGYKKRSIESLARRDKRKQEHSRILASNEGKLNNNLQVLSKTTKQLSTKSSLRSPSKHKQTSAGSLNVQFNEKRASSGETRIQLPRKNSKTTKKDSDRGLDRMGSPGSKSLTERMSMAFKTIN